MASDEDAIGCQCKNSNQVRVQVQSVNIKMKLGESLSSFTQTQARTVGIVVGGGALYPLDRRLFVYVNWLWIDKISLKSQQNAIQFMHFYGCVEDESKRAEMKGSTCRPWMTMKRHSTHYYSCPHRSPTMHCHLHHEQLHSSPNQPILRSHQPPSKISP